MLTRDMGRKEGADTLHILYFVVVALYYLRYGVLLNRDISEIYSITFG